MLLSVYSSLPFGIGTLKFPRLRNIPATPQWQPKPLCNPLMDRNHTTATRTSIAPQKSAVGSYSILYLAFYLFFSKKGRPIYFSLWSPALESFPTMFFFVLETALDENIFPHTTSVTTVCMHQQNKPQWSTVPVMAILTWPSAQRYPGQVSCAPVV